MKLQHTLLTGALVLCALPAPGQAATGAEILKNQCASCHAVSKPDAASRDRLLTRLGPDLHYAGVKFNKDWLLAWLQKPTTLRPGGAMFVNATTPTPGGVDAIDASKVPAHPRLSSADAAAVADALMTLGLNDGLVEKGAYKNAPPNSMAALLFNKLRGCASCHAAKPDAGGISGPELHTSGDRLQPDYVVEYIRNPQKFDPHVWMPQLNLNEADVQKLAGYLTTLKQGAAK